MILNFSESEMGIYTKDEAALRVADEITVILKDIPEDKKIKYNMKKDYIYSNAKSSICLIGRDEDERRTC